jgi:hypothetical protein
MDSKVKDLIRLIECLARPRRRPGQPNPDDYASREVFEKAHGQRVAIEDKTDG